jgi:hypothetical protein
MTHEKKTDGFEALTEEEMNKAFRYYNYVREFYGYLCDSLDLVFEDGCDEFDPAYAPAEKEFPPAEGIDENSAAKAKTIDEMSRTVRAYETMQSIIAILDKDGVEKAAQNRGMLQDTHKFALTSIAEYFPTTSLWCEFSSPAQSQLTKYANDAQNAVSLMEPLALESAIHKIFAEQKECLEKFLPQKIETLKKLKAEMENSYKGKMDWSNHLCQRELVDVVTDYAFALDTLDDYDSREPSRGHGNDGENRGELDGIMKGDPRLRGDDRVWLAKSTQKDSCGFAGTFTANCPGSSGMQ